MKAKLTFPIRYAWLLAAVLLLAACTGPQATAGTIEVSIHADGRSLTESVASGSTVQQALEQAGVSLGELDQVSPPGYTVLTEGAIVRVRRVGERFEIEEHILPFERQTVRNEALPEGETRLLQAGKNGTEEITYRIVEEEGVEISRTPVKRTLLEPPQAEIVMVGAQAAHTPLAIEGRLAYASAGNAWVMETSTGNRRPLVLSGDVDGRVFELSPEGDWLLFTRAQPPSADAINRLWVVSTIDDEAVPVDLGVENVVHFAGWSPDRRRLLVAYSTVEPRPASPGWQANNDLRVLLLSRSGRVVDQETWIEANAGGQYGWWGTDFSWAGDGQQLAYARADSIGIVRAGESTFDALAEITPYQTFGDWAWLPPVAWGQDSQVLFFVDHGGPVGIEAAAASPEFDLLALPGNGLRLKLVSRTGMFAHPSASPALEYPNGELAYHIAYLEALAPLTSQESSYRVMVIDRDGSNRRAVFPEQGEVGLRGDDLQRPPEWSPDGERLAVIYRGDLWLVDVETGEGQPLTGDGQTLAYDWSN